LQKKVQRLKAESTGDLRYTVGWDSNFGCFICNIR